MANTGVQRDVERWVCHTWLKRKYHREFSPQRVRLTPGGVFQFDAVSEDQRVAACISTSSAKTASGKHAAGKIHKIRSDMLFLLLARARHRVAVFTERDMLYFWRDERAHGRLPKNIELVSVTLPRPLNQRLRRARRRSSQEARPTKSAGRSRGERISGSRRP
jgi:hypothetical protein